MRRTTTTRTSADGATARSATARVGAFGAAAVGRKFMDPTKACVFRACQHLRRPQWRLERMLDGK